MRRPAHLLIFFPTLFGLILKFDGDPGQTNFTPLISDSELHGSKCEKYLMLIGLLFARGLCIHDLLPRIGVFDIYEMSVRISRGY